jgi:hypothetical protein
MAGAAIALTVSLAGCGRARVAVVDGEPISDQDFQSALYRRPEPKQVLQNMIDVKRLLHEATAQGVPVTDDQLNKALERLKSDPPANGPTYESLQQEKLTDKFIQQWLLAPDEALSNLVLKEYGSKVKPADLTRFYDSNKAFLDKKERFRIRVARFSDQKKAQQASEMLKKGGSFEGAAEQSGTPAVSLTVEVNQPGIPPALMSALASTPPGKATPPVAIPQQGMNPTSPNATLWILANVDAKLPAAKLKLDDPDTQRRLKLMVVFQDQGKVPGGPMAFRQKILESARQRGSLMVVPEPLKQIETAPPPAAAPGM